MLWDFDNFINTAGVRRMKCGAKFDTPAGGCSNFTPQFVHFKAAVIEYSGCKKSEMWGKICYTRWQS